MNQHSNLIIGEISIILSNLKKLWCLMSKKNIKYSFDKLEISANFVLVLLSGYPLETFLS